VQWEVKNLQVRKSFIELTNEVAALPVGDFTTEDQSYVMIERKTSQKHFDLIVCLDCPDDKKLTKLLSKLHSECEQREIPLLQLTDSDYEHPLQTSPFPNTKRLTLFSTITAPLDQDLFLHRTSQLVTNRKQYELLLSEKSKVEYAKSVLEAIQAGVILTDIELIKISEEIDKHSLDDMLVFSKLNRTVSYSAQSTRSTSRKAHRHDRKTSTSTNKPEIIKNKVPENAVEVSNACPAVIGSEVTGRNINPSKKMSAQPFFQTLDSPLDLRRVCYQLESAENFNIRPEALVDPTLQKGRIRTNSFGESVYIPPLKLPAPDLLTVKGHNKLSCPDAIIYSLNNSNKNSTINSNINSSNKSRDGSTSKLKIDKNHIDCVTEMYLSHSIVNNNDKILVIKSTDKLEDQQIILPNAVK